MGCQLFFYKQNSLPLLLRIIVEREEECEHLASPFLGEVAAKPTERVSDYKLTIRSKNFAVVHPAYDLTLSGVGISQLIESLL